MKFSNGCWLQKEGVGCFSPSMIYFAEVKTGEVKKDFTKSMESLKVDSIRFVLPTHSVTNRGATLGGVNLELEISAPHQGVFRLRTTHYKGAVKDSPEFDLNMDADVKLDVSYENGIYTVANGELKLVLDEKTGNLEYLRGDVVLTKSADRDLAYMRTGWTGDAYVKSSDPEGYVREQLRTGVGELYYGLGERFTPFVKNGQTVDIWNEDGGTSTEYSYKNIPFVLSNKGYGIFVNSTDAVSFEINSEIVNKIGFTVPGECLDYMFIDGPSIKEVIKKYTDITGKPALPPLWSFGLWLSTSFTTNYDEATVMEFIDGMLDRGIPLKVFHFDCFWMKDYHWTDFVWDERVFPDPAGLIGRIHEKGLKVCVWINPYIAQESVLFEEGMEKGYFLKRTDGSVWQWDMWQPGMAIVDFTNPDAKQWFQDGLRKLMEMGVDCFKTDFGERIPVDAVYYNKKNSRKMHNYYTYIYNQAVFEVLEEKYGKDQAVLFARSATVGGQKFPVHWGGDCWSDYESMEESLRGGLSLMLSGFGFWSHDIGGFENRSTADVYKRWAAFGLMSSHSRLHGSTSYRVPWSYDEEAVDVVRAFTRLKAKMMPYLWRYAIEAHKDGVSMMRPMLMEFPDDRMCAYLDRQYMIGEHMLVAPIFNAEGIGEIYLPDAETEWVDYFTKQTYQGGTWVTRKYGYLEIPVFIRQDSILPMGAKEDGPEYDFADGAIFEIYGLKTKASAEIYDGTAMKCASIEAVVSGNDISITIQTEKPFEIRFYGVEVSAVKGAMVKEQDGHLFLTDCQKHIELKI